MENMDVERTSVRFVVERLLMSTLSLHSRKLMKKVNLRVLTSMMLKLIGSELVRGYCLLTLALTFCLLF